MALRSDILRTVEKGLRSEAQKIKKKIDGVAGSG